MSLDPTAAEATLRTIAMPADTNPRGDIFGGWLLAQMDLAGASTAIRRAHGRVVTVAIDAMVFHEPVEVGDEVTCYTRIRKVGRTSICIDVEAWKRRQDDERRVRVTEGLFTYVKIDERRRPVPLPTEQGSSDGGGDNY